MRTSVGLFLVLGLSGAVAAQAPPLFSTHADLVVLHVAVTTRDASYVAGLDRDAFTVFEDDVPQPITLFSAEDAPATIGMLIDDSASMFGLRDLVSAGAATFTATSNRSDEIFALAFNEHVRPVLPDGMPFTGEADVLRYYLQKAIGAHGRTALYDAVHTGLDHLALGGHSRKVLVILSDGGDNASGTTLDEMVNAAASSNTVIYAVAMRDPADRDAQPGLLKRLAHASGGLAFEPRRPTDVGRTLERIARDIRSSYTVAYAPPPGAPGVRHVRVTARARDGAMLHARTRSEYVAVK